MAKTGPKPLPPEEFAAKHSERLNYTLVEVLADREFKVRCNACNELRTVRGNKGGTGPKCVCTRKRKFYMLKRTGRLHTEELHEKGYAEYECLKLGEQDGKFESTSINTYEHECGHRFDMTFACFKMCIVPCEVCRPIGPGMHNGHAKYVARVAGRTKKIEVVGEYLGLQMPIEHLYVKCGHVVEHSPESLFRNKELGRCPVCHPTHVWHWFKVKGKRFRTRSLVERDFVKWLVYEKDVPVEKIEYEPASCRIRYYNPVLEREADYIPDFKVGPTRVELKDLASLGLKDYHWQDKDEALIVNRAKHEAANSQFKDYRTYVYVKGEFHLTDRFWTRKEKQRLLGI
jgi:hypothetical protein